MEDADRDTASSANRLSLCRENFDDYVVALTAKLRSNIHADRVLSGETLHPLLAFQDQNRDALAALNVPWVPPQALFNDPVTPYVTFIRQITDALLHTQAPVPNIDGLDELQNSQAEFRRAETFIYTTIVNTLRVGKTMHYARRVC